LQTERIELLAAAPGVRHSLQLLRFGRVGSRPKATIQAALHADEVPGILVAHALRQRLAALEAAGELIGEVQLVPYANPIGLTQHLHGQHHGRFDLADGINFNRLHPELAAAAAERLAGRLGPDRARNLSLVREALVRAAAELTATTPAQDLKNKLVQQAIDSDIVLDLHCDAESVLHLYGLTPQEPIAAELGALLGARAILLATESGDSPFDEACSRPWLQLQQRFGEAAVPLGCFCVTVELRGQADTDHHQAAADADAIIDFLRRRGLLSGPARPLPQPLCEATPLAASEPLIAPAAGVIVFHAEPGDTVAAGQVVADVVDADSGAVMPVRSASAGVLYARIATRWATPGMRLAKVAGRTLRRSGKLLSA
jgi:uncharacterized protein